MKSSSVLPSEKKKSPFEVKVDPNAENNKDERE